MIQKPVILFDFDGTIADTFPLMVEIFNQLASEYGFKKSDKETLELLRNKSAREVIQYLKIPMYKVPFFIKKGLDEIRKNIEIVTPIQGIQEVLKVLKQEGYILGILTSNSEKNVIKFLDKNNLDFFDYIYSGTNIFGKSKLFSKFLREQKLQNEDVLYVGDEVRDIEAAKKSHLKIISVAWGFNAKEILEKHNPGQVISHPNELVPAVTMLHN